MEQMRDAYQEDKNDLERRNEDIIDEFGELMRETEYKQEQVHLKKEREKDALQKRNEALANEFTQYREESEKELEKVRLIQENEKEGWKRRFDDVNAEFARYKEETQQILLEEGNEKNRLKKRIGLLHLENAGLKAKSSEAHKKRDQIDFRLCHEGITRRFSLRRCHLLPDLKGKAEEMAGGEDCTIFWIDDEVNRMILDTEDDLNEAIKFAESQKGGEHNLFIDLEIGVEKKEKRKEVTESESCASFGGVFFWCDSCGCYLVTKNGGRFECCVCTNYDCCADCLAKGTHPNHAFVRFMDGKTDAGDFRSQSERTRAIRDMQKTSAGEEKEGNDDSKKVLKKTSIKCDSDDVTPFLKRAKK
ncbi:hypothetical protein PMAYCL1PPCAC_14477 [Pristionchus mayeri]|uniref:ZZ-type domain-containing protein n=1 Tax=Pristionchus mayeri TaxID=1317129 RepID=A0AAN5CH05_9BILA|nr:hypothetical protein PMAYCL1PPCAC_14477 [Pristionchus mayeri]